MGEKVGGNSKSMLHSILPPVRMFAILPSRSLFISIYPALLLKKAYQALNDKKAEEITLLEIGQISPIADYFVIASGSNVNQLNAMKDAVDEVMYTNGLHARQIEGNSKSTWILMDYGDMIVHLFSKEDRLFYNLERIWKDGKEINPEEL